ncbi:Trypsin [Tsukamurella paurometabola]|uniref:Trypsin n=2 Tax=Tsukamurella paurometabola TaxID=2061 RepID=A0A3P8MAM6_TSUPA|nr:Trypsin [Tsukamurella paurometabola]
MGFKRVAVVGAATAVVSCMGVPGVVSAAPAPGGRSVVPVVGPGSEVGVVQEWGVGGRVRVKSCTVGVVAERPDGRRVAVTAGHCGEPGQQVGARAAGVDGFVRVGAVAKSVAPRSRVDPKTGESYVVDALAADWAVVDLSPRVSTRVARGPVRQTVVGVARVGDRVCQQGITSGWRCGSVLAVKGALFATDIKSRPGDSGGPVMRLADGAALGIASRGTGDDVSAGEQVTIYTGLQDVLARGGGLRLATGDRAGVSAGRMVSVDEEAVVLPEAMSAPALLRAASVEAAAIVG